MDSETLDQKGLILEPRPAELCQIKDYAVLMEMAGSYLCEEIILNKLAEGIEQNLESLKDYVYRVRRQFVGKPLHEVDIKGPYNNIQEVAKFLRRPDESTKERFKEGGVGRTLMEATQEMAEAIEELIERVQGKTEKYRKRDLFIQAYDRLKFFVHTIATTYKLLTRILIGVAVACLVAFVVLFTTMETQKDVLVQVGQVKATIEKKQKALAKVSALILQVRQERQILEQKQDEFSREDKIKLIELKLREHNLKQKKEKIQFELDAEQKVLDQNMRRLQEIKSKSFFRRLLRLS